MNKSKKNTFTQREIGDATNNAVVRALRPASLGEIQEARLRQLRAYSQGLLGPTLKHVEDEVLKPEELVIVLTTAALFVQLKHVMGTDKMPLGPKVIELYEGPSAVVLPEKYLETPEPTEDEILPSVVKKGRRKK